MTNAENSLRVASTQAETHGARIATCRRREPGRCSRCLIRSKLGTELGEIVIHRT